jgi:hypothetical protein
MPANYETLIDEPVQEPAPNPVSASEIACRNCGHTIETNYCPKCGQHNRDHNIGIWQFVHEFAEEFVRLDSKLFRTLGPLIVKPGFLTREWVAGKRVRYITPLKLYITLSAICFLGMSLRSASTNVQIARDTPKVVRALSQQAKPDDRSVMDALTHWETKKLAISGPKATENLVGFRDKFMSMMPTVNFVLLPIFALLFKLLYVRRSRFYAEHLVFAFHYYAFCSLILTATLAIPNQALSSALGMWMVVYLFLAMLKNYGQSWYATLFKLFLFGCTYLTFVGLAMVGAVLWIVKDLPSH